MTGIAERVRDGGRSTHVILAAGGELTAQRVWVRRDNVTVAAARALDVQSRVGTPAPTPRPRHGMLAMGDRAVFLGHVPVMFPTCAQQPRPHPEPQVRP